jgi:hypothetical protein
VNRQLALALMVLGICACVNRVNVLKPTGEAASLNLANGAILHGELWSVSDSVLVFESACQILTVPLAEVRRVRVEGYDLRKERKWAMLPPLVVYSAGLVLGVALIVGGYDWLAGELVLFSGAMIPATLCSFQTGDPKTDFRSPLKSKDIAALRLYCRYPQGLTEEQLAQLRALNR